MKITKMAVEFDRDEMLHGGMIQNKLTELIEKIHEIPEAAIEGKKTILTLEYSTTFNSNDVLVVVTFVDEVDNEEHRP